MTEKIFVAVGLLVQLFGITIALYGYRIGWDESALSADRFIAPIVRAADRLRLVTDRLLRTLRIRRSAPRVAAGAMSAAVIGVAGHVRASVVPGPISPDLDHAAAIVELDRRLRSLIERVNKAEHDLADERDERQDAITRAEATLTRMVNDRAEADRQRDVRGLRIEAWGFLILTIGALIQGIGAFFGN